MNYSLGKLLGEGAFGEVYIGKDTKTGEVVAIKQFDIYRKKYWNHELSILEKLPINIHLPRLIGSYKEDVDYLYIISNFISGTEFARYQNSTPISKRRSPDMLSVVNSLATQMLDALKTLHSVGIVHRDVKQENIMYDPKTITFVLIDVGGACDSRGCLEPAGTAELLHPDLVEAYELFDNGYESDLPSDIEIYKRGDVYSLGIVLFEFVEEQAPYTPIRTRSSYRVYDFTKQNEVTYFDPKLNRIIDLMITGTHNADDIIYEFTRTI